MKIHEHVVKGRSTRPHLKDTFFLTPKTSNSMYGTLKKYPEGGWRHYPKEGKVYVHCNHYRFQSEEYFLNIKSKKTYADRDNDEAERKMHRMQDWWGANGKDYIIDTELRDKKNGIKGI